MIFSIPGHVCRKHEQSIYWQTGMNCGTDNTTNYISLCWHDWNQVNSSQFRDDVGIIILHVSRGRCYLQCLVAREMLVYGTIHSLQQLRQLSIENIYFQALGCSGMNNSTTRRVPTVTVKYKTLCSWTTFSTLATIICLKFHRTRTKISKTERHRIFLWRRWLWYCQ